MVSVFFVTSGSSRAWQKQVVTFPYDDSVKARFLTLAAIADVSRTFRIVAWVRSVAFFWLAQTRCRLDLAGGRSASSGHVLVFLAGQKTDPYAE